MNLLHKFLIIFVCLSILSILGCGGGGDGTSQSSPSQTATPPELYGYAVKGPFVQGSKITVYHLETTGVQRLLLTSTVLNNEGQYRLIFPEGFSGSVLVVVEGQYRDESSGELKEGTLKLVESIIPGKKESSIDIPSTLVAEMVLGGGSITSDNISEKKQIVSEQLGVGSNIGRRDLLQAAISQLFSSGQTLPEVVQKIVDDLKENQKFDGAIKEKITGEIKKLLSPQAPEYAKLLELSSQERAKKIREERAITGEPSGSLYTVTVHSEKDIAILEGINFSFYDWEGRKVTELSIEKNNKGDFVLENISSSVFYVVGFWGDEPKIFNLISDCQKEFVIDSALLSLSAHILNIVPMTAAGNLSFPNNLMDVFQQYSERHSEDLQNLREFLSIYVSEIKVIQAQEGKNTCIYTTNPFLNGALAPLRKLFETQNNFNSFLDKQEENIKKQVAQEASDAGEPGVLQGAALVESMVSFVSTIQVRHKLGASHLFEAGGPIVTIPTEINSIRIVLQTLKPKEIETSSISVWKQENSIFVPVSGATVTKDTEHSVIEITFSDDLRADQYHVIALELEDLRKAHISFLPFEWPHTKKDAHDVYATFEIKKDDFDKKFQNYGLNSTDYYSSEHVVGDKIQIQFPLDNLYFRGGPILERYREGMRFSLKDAAGAPLFYIQGPFHPLKTVASQGPFSVVTFVLFSELSKEAQDRYIEERALDREAITPQDEVAISVPLYYQGLDIAPNAKEYDCYKCTPVQKAVLDGSLIQGSLPAPPFLFSEYAWWEDTSPGTLALYRPGYFSHLILNPAYAQFGSDSQGGFRNKKGESLVQNSNFPVSRQPFPAGYQPNQEEVMANALMSWGSMYIYTEDRNSWSPLYQEFQDTILEDVSDEGVQSYDLSATDQKILSDILFGEDAQTSEEVQFLKKVRFFLDGIDQGWDVMKDVHSIFFEELISSQELHPLFQELGVQPAPASARFEPQNVHREILIKAYFIFLKYAQLNPKESNSVQKLFKDMTNTLKTYGDPVFHHPNSKYIGFAIAGPSYSGSQAVYDMIIDVFKTTAFVSDPQASWERIKKSEDPKLAIRDPEQAAEIAKQHADEVFGAAMGVAIVSGVGKVALSAARNQILKGGAKVAEESLVVENSARIPPTSPKILKEIPESSPSASRPLLNAYKGPLPKKVPLRSPPPGRFHQSDAPLYRAKRINDFDEQKAIAIMKGDSVDPRSE